MAKFREENIATSCEENFVRRHRLGDPKSPLVLGTEITKKAHPSVSKNQIIFNDDINSYEQTTHVHARWRVAVADDGTMMAVLQHEGVCLLLLSGLGGTATRLNSTAELGTQLMIKKYRVLYNLQTPNIPC